MAISKKTWLIVGLFPTAMEIAIALFAPANTLEMAPGLLDCLRILESYVPSLAGYVVGATNRQVAAVFFIVAWGILPWQGGIWSWIMYRFFDFGLVINSVGRLGLLKLLFRVLIVVTVCFFSLYWVPTEWSVARSFGINASRVGLAFFGAGGFLFVAAGLGFLVNAMYVLVRGQHV